MILRTFEDKFNTLIIGSEHFGAYERLILANGIKEAIVSNVEISDSCQDNSDISDRRTQLLSQIKKFQDSVIESVSSMANNEEFYDGSVKDFNEAKNGLMQLVADELRLYKNATIPDIVLNRSIYQEHKRSLERIFENCAKQKYNILILGEFQTGKTTTINALCDGRHIGAMGNGTATSAVPMSVSYSDKDDIKIDWRSKEQLRQLFEYANRIFDDFNYSLFDLDNADHRDTWLNRLEELRTSKDCPADIKSTAIYSLILRYYGTTELNEAKDRLSSIINIYAVKFPNDFENRWKEGGYSAFNADEIIFAFINIINCYCASETLKQLNCTIIDSPGLFYNQYDTAVTEKLMIEAHAILYLLPHDKVRGQDEIESLVNIKNNYKDFHRKLFIAQNFSYCQNRTEVYDVNRNIVSRLFGENQVVERYDARMSYLGQVLKAFQNGKLSEDDKLEFSKPIEMEHPLLGSKKKIRLDFNGDFNAAFNQHFNAYQQVCPIICGWNNTPTPDVIIKDSGLINLIERLQKFIENNEAYSIIFSSGIYTLRDELLALMSELRSDYITPYLKGKAAIEELWEQKLDKASQFSEYLDKKVKFTLFENIENGLSLSDRLTNCIYDKLFTDRFYDDLYNDICNALYDEKSEITKYISIRGFDKESFCRFITPIISKILQLRIESKIIGWRSIVASGQDQDFANIFTPKMKDLALELKNKWNELYAEYGDIEYINYVTLHTNIQSYVNSGNHINNIHGEYRSSVAHVAIPTALLAEIVALAASVLASAIALAIGISISSPAGWVLILVGGVALATHTFGKTREWMRNRFIELMKPDLKKMFREKDIFGTIKGIIKEDINQILKKCQSSIAIDIKKMEEKRDFVLYSPEETSEGNCFSAIGQMELFNKQIKQYKLFINVNNTTHD